MGSENCPEAPVPPPAWSWPPNGTLDAGLADNGPTRRVEIQLALKYTTCAASMPNPPRWAPLASFSPSGLRRAQRDSSTSISSSAEPDPDKQQHETSTSRDDMGEAPSKEETAVASASADVTTTETAQSTELSRQRSTMGTGEDEGRKNLPSSQATEASSAANEKEPIGIQAGLVDGEQGVQPPHVEKAE